jgi:hypothetical protein
MLAWRVLIAPPAQLPTTSSSVSRTHARSPLHHTAPCTSLPTPRPHQQETRESSHYKASLAPKALYATPDCPSAHTSHTRASPPPHLSHVRARVLGQASCLFCPLRPLPSPSHPILPDPSPPHSTPRHAAFSHASFRARPGLYPCPYPSQRRGASLWPRWKFRMQRKKRGSQMRHRPDRPLWTVGISFAPHRSQMRDRTPRLALDRLRRVRSRQTTRRMRM